MISVITSLWISIIILIENLTDLIHFENGNIHAYAHYPETNVTALYDDSISLFVMIFSKKSISEQLATSHCDMWQHFP